MKPGRQPTSGSDGTRRSGKGWRCFARTRRSAVSVEISIVAVPFFLLMLGTMEVCYDIFVKAALNAVVYSTARMVWSGTAQMADTSQGGRAFINTYVCPNLAGPLDCSLIQMNILPWTQGNYYTSPPPAYVTGTGPGATLATSSWSVCTGGPQTLVLLQAVYAGPTFLGALSKAFSVTYNGALIHPTYAATSFVNQSFTATVSC